MPYPEALVHPMRQELTRLGIRELTNAEEVDAVFQQADDATLLLVINSVCGCAAANARPAVALASNSAIQPEYRVTVFAGQDVEATARAREYLDGIPPSSPFIGLFKHGEPVFVLERRHIEGRSASAIAGDLVGAYNKHCGTSSGESSGGPESPDANVAQNQDLPDTFRSIL